jgi:hypothetical protein
MITFIVVDKHFEYCVVKLYHFDAAPALAKKNKANTAPAPAETPVHWL